MASLRSSSPAVKIPTPIPLPLPPPSSSLFRPRSSLLRLPKPLRASRRTPKGAVMEIRDRRSWREIQSLGEEQDYETEDEEEDDDEDDRSLDLLVRFLSNVFRKVSRRARRAVRSVLPIPIPARLVGFSVNGVLILAFLWILKALLEVVCTIGSMVFVSILLVRGALFGIAYLQETRFHLGNRFDNDDDAWSGVQPAT